jgi:crossover junction endodeoxyribonuclease RusA
MMGKRLTGHPHDHQAEYPHQAGIAMKLWRRPYPVEEAALRRARTKTAAQVKQMVAEQWARPSVPVVSIRLPYPTSTNRLWRRTATGISRSPAYATWFRAAGNELNAQHPGRVHGPYALTVSLGRPDRRKRDLDNIVKSISDLLKTNGVVDDDSQAVRITLQWVPVAGAHVLVETVDYAAQRAIYGASSSLEKAA